MDSYFGRGLIAVIVFVLLLIAIPAIISLIGLPIPESALLLIKVCIAGLCLFYVIRGKLW